MDVDKSKRPPPFGVRLTHEERAELERRAERAGLTLGGYLKSVVFNTPPPRRSRRLAPNADLLARLLAAAGSIGGNVNRCAFIANMGSWPEASRLQSACDDIQWMRHNLMQALGIDPSIPKDQQEP